MPELEAVVEAAMNFCSRVEMNLNFGKGSKVFGLRLHRSAKVKKYVWIKQRHEITRMTCNMLRDIIWEDERNSQCKNCKKLQSRFSLKRVDRHFSGYVIYKIICCILLVAPVRTGLILAFLDWMIESCNLPLSTLSSLVPNNCYNSAEVTRRVVFNGVCFWKW